MSTIVVLHKVCQNPSPSILSMKYISYRDFELRDEDHPGENFVSCERVGTLKNGGCSNPLSPAPQDLLSQRLRRIREQLVTGLIWIALGLTMIIRLAYNGPDEVLSALNAKIQASSASYSSLNACISRLTMVNGCLGHF